MASTFILAPIPIWVILDNDGKPAANCVLYPRSSLDHQAVKNVFQDPAGMIPYPLDANGGIVFGDNGTQGPFYWELNGVDLYFLQVYTAQGDLLSNYTIDNYPISGGGGGGPITILNDLNNFVIDGQFTFHSLGNGLFPIPIASTEIQSIAYFNGAIDTTVEGGWFVIKDLVGNVDTLAVQQPSLSSTSPDSNPRGILTYQCTAPGVGSRMDMTFISGDVKTFQNEQITFQFEANASGAAPVGVGSVVFVRQSFGTGGAPSADVEVTFPFVWPAGVFGKITTSIVVPSTAGKARGIDNNDIFEIGIRMPIGSLGTYQITNVMGVRGTVIPPTYLYETQSDVYTKIESNVHNVFETGDIMQSFRGTDRPGWLRLQSGISIGNTGSGADFTGIQYRSLYLFWWQSFSNAIFPVSGGRGVSALADFNANKRMTQVVTTDYILVNAFGSVFFTAGVAAGSKTHTLTIAELAAHTHDVTVLGRTGAPGTRVGNISNPLINWNPPATTYTTTSTGSGTPFSIIQQSLPVFFFVKL